MRLLRFLCALCVQQFGLRSSAHPLVPEKGVSDSELEETSVIRNFRITVSGGKSYNTQHYNLAAIIAVGYKVNSERAVQFLKWATSILESFTIKGFAMYDECHSM